MIFFFREICGQKAAFLAISCTSTPAWRVKSLMSQNGQLVRFVPYLSSQPCDGLASHPGGGGGGGE